MPATTTLLGLVTPTQGTLSGTWGDTVNYGISDYVDISVAGTLTLTNDGAVTLANTTGSSSGNSITSSLTGAGTVTAQFAIVKVTGTLTVAKVVTGPSYSKTYTVVNSATGGIVTFKASGQTGVSVAVGESAFVYYNGTDYVKVSGTVAVASFQTSLGGLTPSTATTGVVTLAGTLNTTSGGTGLTSFTAGDVPYYASGSVLSKLAIGTAGQFLTSTGTAPQWSTLSGVAVTTFSAGTTGFTPSSATSGAVTLAGTLATTNGGTGLTSFTSGGVVYASSSSALATGSVLSFDGTNLGVGNASPQALLHVGSVVEAPGFGTTSQMSYVNGTSQPEVLVRQTTNDVVVSMYADSTGGAIRTATNHPLSFITNNTEKMRLDTSGNLGIGTSSPAYKLDVLVASNKNVVAFTPTSSSGISDFSTGGVGWRFSRPDGGALVNSVYSYDTAAAAKNNFVIQARSDLVFTNGGDFSGAIERVRIDSSGNVGIGTSSPSTTLTIKTANNVGTQIFKTADTTNSMLGIYDSQAAGNASYTLIGTDTTGAVTGFSSGGNFLSISKNGTGTVRDLILHNYDAANIRFATNNAERARIDSSGCFGVGTSSPASYGGSAFTKSVNIGSLNTITAGFSDGVSGTFRIAHASGQNILNFDTSALCFQSGGSTPTERARIDSSGAFLVGTTTSGGWQANARGEFFSDGAGGFGAAGGVALSVYQSGSSVVAQNIRVNATSTALIQFQYNGATTVGSIKTNGTSIALDKVSGITFPATQSASADANTLDDYEEGTWTPTVTFATAGDLSVVYSIQYGAYTKIGNRVQLDFRITTTTFTWTTASSSFTIAGLPFTASSATNYRSAGSISGTINTTNAGTGSTYLTTVILASGTTMFVQGNSVIVGASATVIATWFTSGTNLALWGSISYTV